MNSMTLEIDGMSCGHCVSAVSSALSTVPGVRVQHVEVGKARIEADRAGAEAAVETLGRAGYRARPEGGAAPKAASGGCCGGRGCCGS